MDLNIVLIFIAGSTWLYGVALLAVVDWRWNFGRLVGFGLLAALTIWIWKLEFYSPFVMWLLFLLLFISLFLPRIILDRVRMLIMRGRAQEARTWEIMRSLVNFQSPFAALRRMDEALRLLSVNWPGVGQDWRELWLHRYLAAWSRKRYLAARIEGLLQVRDFSQAIALFESLPPRKRNLDPLLLYQITAAYAKMGKLREALDCVLRADQPAMPAELDYHRAAALLHLFAFAGRPHTVERLLAESQPLRLLIGSHYARLWRGVAAMRYGDRESAAVELEAAAAQSADPEFAAVVERYRAMLAEGGTASEDADFNAKLDALEERLTVPLTRSIQSMQRGSFFATKAIIAVCIAVSVVAAWMGAGQGDFFNQFASTDPVVLLRLGANSPTLVRAGEWWRLVANIFLHAGMLHLGMNMWALYVLGAFVERFVGRQALAVIFVFSGITGSVVSALLGTHFLAVGASGGIFGLLGACIIITLTTRKLGAEFRRTQLFSFIFLTALCAGFGFVEPHVDNLAHAGGLAGGLIFALFLRPREEASGVRMRLHVLSVVTAVIIAGTAALAFINASSGGYPERVAKWSSYSDTDAGWTVKIPASWQFQQSIAEGTSFQGPLDEMFVIKRHPRRELLRLDKGEHLVAEKKLTANGADVQEVVVTFNNKYGKLACYAFEFETGGAYFTMSLICEPELMKQFRSLAESMPFGVTVTGPMKTKTEIRNE